MRTPPYIQHDTINVDDNLDESVKEMFHLVKKSGDFWVWRSFWSNFLFFGATFVIWEQLLQFLEQLPLFGSN
jgi:hypothetical protein